MKNDYKMMKIRGRGKINKEDNDITNNLAKEMVSWLYSADFVFVNTTSYCSESACTPSHLQTS